VKKAGAGGSREQRSRRELIAPLPHGSRRANLFMGKIDLCLDTPAGRASLFQKSGYPWCAPQLPQPPQLFFVITVQRLV